MQGQEISLQLSGHVWGPPSLLYDPFIVQASEVNPASYPVVTEESFAGGRGAGA
jgi:hypothetical protein